MGASASTNSEVFLLIIGKSFCHGDSFIISRFLPILLAQAQVGDNLFVLGVKKLGKDSAKLFCQLLCDTQLHPIYKYHRQTLHPTRSGPAIISALCACNLCSAEFTASKRSRFKSDGVISFGSRCKTEETAPKLCVLYAGTLYFILLRDFLLQRNQYLQEL